MANLPFTAVSTGKDEPPSLRSKLTSYVFQGKTSSLSSSDENIQSQLLLYESNEGVNKIYYNKNQETIINELNDQSQSKYKISNEDKKRLQVEMRRLRDLNESHPTPRVQFFNDFNMEDNEYDIDEKFDGSKQDPSNDNMSNAMRYYHLTPTTTPKKKTEKKLVSESKDEETKDIAIGTVYHTKNTKRIVFFEMKITRVSNIETTNEKFSCAFQLYLTWLASKEDETLYKACKKNKNQDEYKPEWEPAITWANAIASDENEDTKALYRIKDGTRSGFTKDDWDLDESFFGFKPWNAVWNRARYWYDIEFAEEMELQSFPFDCQDLSMYLKVERDNVNECDFVPFPRNLEYVSFDPAFTVLSEFDFESIVVEFGRTDTKTSKSNQDYALVGTHIKVSRRWEVYIGQALVTFCLFTLGLGTFSFALNEDSLGDRLGYAITLLLADVASIQLVFDSLPRIPYFTLFDYYFYACFAYVFLVTLWTCIGGGIDAHNGSDTDLTSFYDNGLFVIFALLYLVSHIFFIDRALRERKRELRKLTQPPGSLNKQTRDRSPIRVHWNSIVHLFAKKQMIGIGAKEKTPIGDN